MLTNFFARIDQRFREITPEPYCWLVNLGWRLRRKPLRVTHHDGLFRLEFFSEMNRYSIPKEEIWLVTLIRRYKYIDGLNRRLQRLVRLYFLERVPLRPGDTVVDCGANIGEIGLWLSRQRDQVKYYAIEPGVKEGKALRHNLPNAAVDHGALWFEDSLLQFYLEPDTADSSFSDQGNNREAVVVSAYQLGTFLDLNRIDHVRLLKIEAEGSEPEVIVGATAVLDRIDYIAVDMGPEREGKYNTVQACVTLLSASGFNFLAYDHRRHTGLFSRVEENPYSIQPANPIGGAGKQGERVDSAR